MSEPVLNGISFAGRDGADHQALNSRDSSSSRYTPSSSSARIPGMLAPITPRISPYMPTVLVTMRRTCFSRSHQIFSMARRVCPRRLAQPPARPCQHLQSAQDGILYHPRVKEALPLVASVLANAGDTVQHVVDEEVVRLLGRDP
jgi:hypothetical protein